MPPELPRQKIVKLLIKFIRGEIGKPELQISQDETIVLESWEKLGVDDPLFIEGGSWRLIFRYEFDHDFCYYYDKVERRGGEIIIDDDASKVVRGVLGDSDW